MLFQAVDRQLNTLHERGLDGLGGECEGHRSQETDVPSWTCDFVFRIENPRTSASGYTAEPRHEGELPQGATFFNRGEKQA